MPQSVTQTIKAKFNKGLLTEFSELNFPEEASIDELNCDLFKAGNRTKRKGLAYETGSTLTDETYAENTLFHTVSWTNVGGNANLEYLVVQAGNKLRFYRKGSLPLSDGMVMESDVSSTPYILDMTSYEYAGGLGASASKIDVTSIDGRLVVVSPQIEPFYISRDSDDGTFSVEQISFKIRDYGYYSDPATRLVNVPIQTSDVYNPAICSLFPSTPGCGVGEEYIPIQRLYDTQNSGWSGGDRDRGTTALNTYKSDEGGLPPLTHPWYSGKATDGQFSTDDFTEVYAGTSLTANGHFIINLFSSTRKLEGVSVFNPDNSFDTDWEGKALATPQGRFSTVASYAGRAWYAGVDSRVYYSKIIETPEYFGDLYSHNDPTAEFSSDTLATDGGYIRLPEASGIKKLHVFGSSILVFADNGVWRISGVDGNLFKADDFSVYKITDFGLAFRGSFVGGQNAIPFWWSYNGIHTIQVTDQGGMVEANLSRDTIQSFWEDIGSEERSFVTSIYDAVDNKILWMYPNVDETIEHKLNNILYLDADLGAFYPWKMSDKTSSSTPFIVGSSFFNGRGADEIVFNVVDGVGDNVQDSLGNDVVTTRTAGISSASEIFFLTRDPSGSLTFSLFESLEFYDWEDAPYEAYAESAYNFVGDLGRRKNSPYITIFMRQTETGFTLSEGIYTAVNPSSLKVSAYWDFKKNPTSPPQEAYRHKQPIVPEDVDNFPSPTTVLSTRLKLRGRGRVVRLRFEGTEGNNFNLLGWETLDTKNGGY